MKNKSLIKRISAVLICISIICSCFVLSASAVTRSNSFMTSSCTEEKATMKVSTGGTRTESVSCQMDGLSSQYDLLTLITVHNTIDVSKTNNNAISCSLSYTTESTFIMIESILYVTFTGYISQSTVGYWTLTP